MFNFRKRIFLFLTIIAVVLCLVSCTEPNNATRIKFDSVEYTVRMQSYLEVKPTIKVAPSMSIDDIEVVYESSDESIVRYEHGVLYPKSEGEAVIKVYWKDNDVIFDEAVVKVIKPELPEFVCTQEQQFLKGGEGQIAYTLHKNYTDAQAKFESLNPEVALVSESGKVSALKVGTANIHVVVSDYEDVAEYYFTIEVIESDFAINYVLDGGVNAEGNPIGYNTLNTPLPIAAPTKVGYEFEGWYLDGVKVDAIPAGSYGDVTLVAKWNVVTYSVSYDYAGGEVSSENASSYTVEVLPLAIANAPTKAGYEFAGWLINGVAGSEIAAGTTGDVSVVATWTPVKYAITYDYAGGEEIADAVKEYTVEEEVVFGTPTRPGYVFLGWMVDGAPATKIEKGTMGEKTVVATWEKILVFNVSYDLAGGSWAKDVVEFGDELVALFNKYGESTTVTTKENFKATSHPQIKTVWNKAELLAEHKWLFEFALADMTAAGKANNYLDNEYYANVKEMLEKMIAGDTAAVGGSYADGRTIFRFWLEAVMNKKNVAAADIYQKLMVDYSDPANVARFEAALNGVSTQLKAEDKLPTPTRNGFEFAGWSVNGEKVESVTADCTLVAMWTPITYSISYDLAGGSYANDIVKFGDELVALFNKYGESTTVTTKENFKATSHPQIKTVWNKAELLAEHKWLFEFALADMTAAGKANNYLDNEYYANVKEMLEKMIAGDTAAVGGSYADGRTIFRFWLEAVMNKKNVAAADIYQKLMVDYSDPANQARFEAALNNITTSYTALDEVVLPEVSREGYAFSGWYNGDVKVEKIAAGTFGDLELVAKWENLKVYYAINYEVNEGVLPEGAATQYEEGVGLETLPVPTCEGYKFLGWELNGEVVTSIAATQKGDVTLSAKWQEITGTEEYKVTYDLNGGSWSYNVDVFADEVIAMFNRDGGSSTVTTKEEFKATSHPQIKSVYAIAANLEAHKWLFEFAKAEIQAAAEANGYAKNDWYQSLLTNVVELLDKMIAGDTTAIGGDYAQGRTIFRWWLQGVMNKYLAPCDSDYLGLMTDYSVAENLARFENALNGVTDTVLAGQVLPTPAKAGYEFAGWYANGVKVESVSEDCTLVAEWEAVTYSISYDLNGGKWAASVDTFADKLIALFNKYGESSTVTTKEEFKVTSHPQIKTVWNKPETLAEYKWLFEFALAEITAAGTANNYLDNEYYTNVKEMLEKMIAGDTAAIGGSYADGRTILRWWLQGLMNKGVAPADDVYVKLMTDYSVAENLSRFEDLLCDAVFSYTILDELVLAPAKHAEYKFLGWELNGKLIDKIPAGTYGNLQLVAKWQIEEVSSDISYELNEGTLPEDAPKSYVEGVGVKSLPVPVREGYKFMGWTLNGEAVTEISMNQKGAVTLVATWEQIVYGEITYDLDGGTLPEDAPKSYVEGEGLATLPTPTRQGYSFNGWMVNGEVVTSISPSTKGAVTLVATWTEVVVRDKYVGEGLDYASLDEAIATAPEGSIIHLPAGEHALSEKITKSLTIVGPNAGLTAFEARNPEALINVAKDNAGNLSGKNIEFNGVHLKGTGGGAGVPGICFQDGGNMQTLVFRSSIISDTNTFIKLQNGTSPVEILFEDCYIYTIGQFVVWSQTGATKKVTLIGNLVDGSTCGAVTNSAAALFRVRSGVLEAYNNYFNGSSMNVPGYFEALNESVVKYNTFANCMNFVNPAAANKLTFDENLYLNASGNALTSAPKELSSVSSVKADTTVATSEEDRANRYLTHLLTQDPNRYFTIEFDANGGEIQGTYPSVYDTTVGIQKLPQVVNGEYKFLGWYLNGERVESLPAGLSGAMKVVAKWEEAALYVDGQAGEGHYATFAEALAAAKDGEVIIIVAGEYTENVTINTPNLTIKGANAGIDAVNGQRVAETVYKGVITLTSSAKGITIDGFSFTEGAKIKYDENVAYEGFSFQNNKVYDTTEAKALTATEYESRYTLPGFIQFTFASGGYVKNVEIYNNSFVNVSEVNVLINRAVNVSVDGNLFKDYDVDAVRIEGGYSYGSHGYTNNRFEQTVKENGNVGIFLYTSSGGSGTKQYVLIANNEFINLGKDNGTVFTGAIAGYRFQENHIEVTIRDNVFDHCYDYIFLRNNGGNSQTWSCTVENNQFLGLPHNQYFASYRGSDSESTNPHLAVFTQNYYEDNDGNVISDLSQYSSYFKHMASYGSALSAKPGEAEVEKLEFYTISYELNGGETFDTFVTSYDSFINAPIALPSLTKVNHQFNGWSLNGRYVTEISVDTRGDLVLVAEFTVLEGEVYNITFVTNKENVIWPFRAANNREEILNALFVDLYEWAQGNGETRSFADYKAYIDSQLAAYADIKLRNPSLGNYPAEDGSTEYFLNIPKYFQKWSDFFAIFNKAMLAVNSGQIFYSDTYAAMVRLHQFNVWSSTGQGYFQSYIPQMCAATKIPQEIPTSYRGGQVLALPEISLANGLEFLGWYDNAEFNGAKVTTIENTETGDKTFYAKWAEEVKPEKVEINEINELKLFTTHQLVWTITPNNVTDSSVEFFSSNEAVATVNQKGLITALANGKATITMKVYGNRALDVVFEVEVYSPDYIDGGYETESYVKIGDSIMLNADVVSKTGQISDVIWSSLNEEIATVDGDGRVTGIAKGLATIVATNPNDPTMTLEFVVTVVNQEESELIELVLKNHESNVFTRYNLGIGSGIPEYYMDIFGSVSQLLFNHDYKVDDSRKDNEVNSGTGDYFLNMKSTEFITVHYTGNMAAGADAKANANYFVGDNAVSIHYTTGNDGIYQCLNLKDGAWHAGDSGAMDTVGEFKWLATGIKAGVNDPQYPVFTISDDFYYEINGQKTTVPMPKPWNYSSRGTDHILNADGTISSQANFGQTGFSGRTPESFINDMGLPFKVVDGEYYMGTTWWCYTQVYEGRICSTGGNRNSVGIESCVNKGSDLWYTWQITAQLVARLMYDLNLDITRVRGHHFFSGKDCPQPMLRNDCEIWKKFLGLVEAEYEVYTEYSDVQISFVSNNTDIVNSNGRVVSQPTETTCVTYTVTITRGDTTETITLGSMVKGLYVGR